VKPPFLREGRVSDRAVESIDIVPTIADALDLPFPFPVDGRSALDPALRPVVERRAGSVGRSWSIDASLPATWANLEAKRALLGEQPTWDDVWAVSSAPELLGRRVDDLTMGAPSGLSYGLLDPGQFDHVDPARGEVPSFVRGAVWAADAKAIPGEVAVAVDGVVRGVGHTFSLQELTKIMWIVVDERATGAFAMMIPDNAFRTGANHVEAFAVDADRTLHRMTVGVPPRMLLAIWPDS
jgi:hypothetical protein